MGKWCKALQEGKNGHQKHKEQPYEKESCTRSKERKCLKYLPSIKEL